VFVLVLTTGDHMADCLGAYIQHDNVSLPPLGVGPLSGLTFATKDLFDIAGHVTGAGSPDWLVSHQKANVTASSVTKLLSAGAKMVAKAQTDEMAFSITGQNAHYGTPTNVNAVGRIPGGSSSGSAAAVAGRLVDFALGSDTGGSVRVPAGFCGIYGIRTTQDRVPVDGIHPLAPCFDTVGWFSRSGELLQRIGQVLLPEFLPAQEPRCLLIAKDCFACLKDEDRQALRLVIDQISDYFTGQKELKISENGPDKWMPYFRTLQMADVWKSHGDWIRWFKPKFGPGVAERFAMSASIDQDDVKASRLKQAEIRQHMFNLLGTGDILCLPTTPGVAPLLQTPEAILDNFRSRVMALTCVAGLSGCPQINLPVTFINNCPLGLSLMAAPGHDEALLNLAAVIAPRCLHS